MRELTNVLSLFEDHWALTAEYIEKGRRIVEGIDTPGYAQRRADFYRDREGGDEDFSAEFFAAQPGRRIERSEDGLLYRMGVTVTDGGVAVLPIHGVLMKRPMFSLSTKLTSSDMVRDAARRLAEMGSVRSVVLDVDSPGGSVLGIERAAQAIEALAGEKRVVAVANEMMASGGYYVASAATEIVAVETAIVGSIGVYTTRIDATDRYEMEGLKVYVVRAGEHKAEGLPALPFSEGERQRLQREVDYYYDMFKAAVRRGRGISAEEVSSLADGTVEIGTQAVERGFVDGIASLADVVQSETTPSTFSANGTMGIFSSKTDGSTIEAPEAPEASEEVQTEEAQAELEAIRKEREELAAERAEVEARAEALKEKERQAALADVRGMAASLVEKGHVLPKHAESLETLFVSIHEAGVTVEAEDAGTGDVTDVPAANVLAGIFESQGKLVDYDEVAPKSEKAPDVPETTEERAKLIRETMKEQGFKTPAEAVAFLKAEGYSFE